VPTISFLTVSARDPIRLSRIPNFLYCFCTPNPLNPGFGSSLSIEGHRGKTYDGFGLRKAFEQMLKIKGEGSWAVQALQMPALAAVGQGWQEVGEDPQLGHRYESGTQARTITRTGSQRHRASKEARPHHHPVGRRSVPERNDSAFPCQANSG